MILGDFLIALIIAMFFTMVLAVSGQKHRSGKKIVAIFLIILFTSWAGGVWISPIGPSFLGIYWISFFIIALIIALVMEIMAVLHATPSNIDKRETYKKEETLEILLGISFITLMIAVIIIIIAGYFHRS
jgi:hypothetical protein